MAKELKSLTLNGKKYDDFGKATIEVLDADPIGEDLTEGRMWVLRVGDNTLTIPVIELGNVSENSISIKLSNASFDGSGAVVTTYRIYVNGSYAKSENINAGGTFTVSELAKGTKYQISVRGVKGNAISAWSNTLSVTTAGEPVVPDVPDEPDVPDVPYEPVTGIVYVVGANVNGYTSGQITIADLPDRAVGLYLTGEKAAVNKVSEGVYYPIPVPADATTCVVVCPGLIYGFCGWNLSDSNAYSYDVDGGWTASGVAYEFEAGAAEYATISFKRADGGNLTESDVVNITVSFA